MVSCIGSALENTFKFLADILSPLLNKNGCSVKNSIQFANEVASTEIMDDEVMVSFDLVKLNLDPKLQSRTFLTTDKIIYLHEFVLSNNYFVFNDQIFNQIHGYAMGSSVSPVVANLCMEIIEDTALTTTAMTPSIYKRYVDNCFAIIKKDFVSIFLLNLNSVDANNTFT